MRTEDTILRAILARCPPDGDPDVARRVRRWEGRTKFPERNGFAEALVESAGLDEEYAEAFHQWMLDEGLVEIEESRIPEHGWYIYDQKRADRRKMVGYIPSENDDPFHGETIWVYRLTDLGRELVAYVDQLAGPTK